MIIKNSTKWSTEDLRKFFKKCVREVDSIEQPQSSFYKRNKHFQLDILNGRQLRGRATVNGLWIMIKIPRGYKNPDGQTELKEMRLENKKSLALTIIHEYYHTIGFKNQDRCNYKYDFTESYDVEWVKDYQIKEKEIIKKPKADIKLKRYQQAIQNLRRAETRLKRAKTFHQKWQTKIKYYQKTCNFNK